MVGQYQGPTGTAALAVVAPVWNIIYSLGLLTGIGGSVLLSTMRGQAAGSEKRSNEYFSAAVIGTVILAALAWAGLLFFDRPLLTLFGAEETLLPLARAYLFPIKFVVPSFLFTQLMSAFLRNDGDPALATKAVLFGGIFNVFGDYFFVFTLDMGIMGAGIATAMGSVFSLIIMLTHFFRKKNTLHPCEWIFPFCARSAGSGCPGASAPKPSQSKCRKTPPAQEVPAGHRGGVPRRLPSLCQALSCFSRFRFSRTKGLFAAICPRVGHPFICPQSAQVSRPFSRTQLCTGQSLSQKGVFAPSRRQPVQRIISGVMVTPLSFVHRAAVFSRRALSLASAAILASQVSQFSPQQPIRRCCFRRL